MCVYLYFGAAVGWLQRGACACHECRARAVRDGLSCLQRSLR